MAKIAITPDKKEEVVKLWKSLSEIDRCIEPFQEQKKELREHFVKEKQILTNEEYNLAKKTYTWMKAKKRVDIDDFSSFIDIFEENFATSESDSDDGKF